jgi:transcriptional regulator with XRE-family HTH domain
MATQLGEKIRAERKRLKLTLDQLAVHSYSSKSYIWELENRPVVRPSAEKISKIAEVLGVTAEYLLDDSKDSPVMSDHDQAFFRKFTKLNPDKKAQLEAILKVLDDT